MAKYSVLGNKVKVANDGQHVGFKLKTSYIEELVEYANATGQTFSAYVRGVLVEHLNEKRGTTQNDKM